MILIPSDCLFVPERVWRAVPLQRGGQRAGQVLPGGVPDRTGRLHQLPHHLCPPSARQGAG